MVTGQESREQTEHHSLAGTEGWRVLTVPFMEAALGGLFPLTHPTPLLTTPSPATKHLSLPRPFWVLTGVWSPFPGDRLQFYLGQLVP